MREVWIVPQIKVKKVGGVSLLSKLKLNEFHFCKKYCQVFITDKYFQEKYNIKSHSLSGSRMVGEAFHSPWVYNPIALLYN